MKSKMQWSYLFKHWFATLLIAPFLTDLLFYIDPNNHKIGGFVEVYPIIIWLSFLFSIPTYAVYSIVFYYLKKKQFSLIFSKRILIAISVVGIFITFTLIFPDIYFPATLAYMLTSLVTGIFFKLEKRLPAKN
ncbi:hypothetical protein SAMN02927937_01334 [Paenimyroides aquimaris]|uniref:Uncharacterized protein n=1 Tax=Paenimyroides marinum TaxID=1159016 RepID=A0A1H6KMU2_9FLAO|nr:hypothetical protein [Paenimyroides aquimaris]SEH77031.1 hypothetical protein SAMN02927937_01334 [Paenimyroides aquimaris]